MHEPKSTFEEQKLKDSPNAPGRQAGFVKVVLMALLATLPVLLYAKDGAASAWKVDYTNSRIAFTVDSRLGAVDGVFHRWKFEGRISEELTPLGKIIVDVSSIDTQNQKRDEHLRDPDFFEVEKYPTAVFKFDKIEKRSSYFLVSGKLRIRDKQRDIKFKLKKIKEGPKRLQLKSLFILDRKDFGITYNSFINPIEDEIVMRIHLSLRKTNGPVYRKSPAQNFE